MSHSESLNIDELSRFAVDVLQRAGDAALKYYSKGDPQVKFDDALVTEAELYLVNFMHGQLSSRFPEHQIFGDVPPRKEYIHGQKGYLWIYDALDGVANFQSGIPIWGTSLALLENFWPIFGVFYMPVSKDLFYAHAGGKAFWGTKEIHVPPPAEINNESVLLTYSRFHQHYHRSTFPGKIRNLGCTGAHLCYVAGGRAEAALLANVSYKDLAASQIILEAAGGEILKLDGSKFHLNEYLEGQKIDEYLLAVPEGAHSSIKMYIQEGSLQGAGRSGM